MKSQLLPVAVTLFTCLGVASPCPKNINTLPRFGRIKKCPEQIEDDKKILIYEQQFGSREEIASELVKLGWNYLAKNQVDVAMHRFNQAWLLDSLNEQINWGFGSTLGSQGKERESLPFFRAAVISNASNARVWYDASVSYGSMFFATKQISYLDTTILYLKKSARLNSSYAPTYAQLGCTDNYLCVRD
ncbi:MAG: hypothetical protein ACRYFR_08950 [Janthinobacterium lividum]